MSDKTEKDAQPERDPKTGAFLKGKKGGPGRPKGNRNKLGEAFLADMHDDWLVNGVDVIQRVREEKPDVYLKTVASILPRDMNLNINPLEEADDAELIQRLRDLESVIRPFLGAEGSGKDSERTGPPRPN